MRFLNLLSTLALIATSSTTSAAVLRRDALTDLQFVNSDIRTLTNLINQSDGSVTALSPIFSSYNRYKADLNATVANIQASSCTPLATACTSLTNYLGATFYPTLTTHLNAVVALRPKLVPELVPLYRRLVTEPQPLYRTYCATGLQPRCPSAALSTFCANVQAAFADAQTRYG